MEGNAELLDILRFYFISYRMEYNVLMMSFGIKIDRKVVETQLIQLNNVNSYSHMKANT